jgi:AcrR family transcriptional regulator
VRANKAKKRSPARRHPKQRRSRQTFDAILEAVARVLKQGGALGITTNRIAAAAGVSIGSVYQYFPDKGAIFAALLERHVDEMSRIVETTLAQHASSPTEVLVRALIGAMVEAHTVDPDLHELLFTVPHSAEGAAAFEDRLRRALRKALAARKHEMQRDLERILFILTPMIEALAHGVVLRRPPRLSLAAAKEEAARAVLAYLRA